MMHSQIIIVFLLYSNDTTIYLGYHPIVNMLIIKGLGNFAKGLSMVGAF